MLLPKFTRRQKKEIEAEGLDNVTQEEVQAYRSGEYIPKNIIKALEALIEDIRLNRIYNSVYPKEKETFEMTELVFNEIRGVAISILKSRFCGTDKGFTYCIPIAIDHLYKGKNKKEKKHIKKLYWDFSKNNKPDFDPDVDLKKKASNDK